MYQSVGVNVGEMGEEICSTMVQNEILHIAHDLPVSLMGICCYGAQLLAAFIVDGCGMRVQHKGDCEETLSGIRSVYLGGGACSVL